MADLTGYIGDTLVYCHNVWAYAGGAMLWSYDEIPGLTCQQSLTGDWNNGADSIVTNACTCAAFPNFVETIDLGSGTYWGDRGVVYTYFETSGITNSNLGNTIFSYRIDPATSNEELHYNYIMKVWSPSERTYQPQSIEKIGATIYLKDPGMDGDYGNQYLGSFIDPYG